MPTLILASGSEIRRTLLANAGIDILVENSRVDEAPLKEGLLAEGATPRDLADALAEMKARKVSSRNPKALTLGCDQVLAFGDQVLSKPQDIEHARSQLRQLRGQQHQLLSAAVLYEDAKPVWRHVSVARLRMRDFSDDYLDDYLNRNWESIRHSVGAYKLEEEGVRLFSRVDGDYFTILGLPLIELLSYLTLRGTLPA